MHAKIQLECWAHRSAPEILNNVLAPLKLWSKMKGVKVRSTKAIVEDP